MKTRSRSALPISTIVDCDHRERMSPERRLLAALLGRSLVDTAGGMRGAYKWFTDPDRGLLSFNFVCEHLFDRPDDARREILKNLNNPRFATKVISSLGGQGMREVALSLRLKGNK